MSSFDLQIGLFLCYEVRRFLAFQLVKTSELFAFTSSVSLSCIWNGSVQRPFCSQLVMCAFFAYSSLIQNHYSNVDKGILLAIAQFDRIGRA